MQSKILFNLRKFLAPEIVYGEGALTLAGHHALNLGATRVLLVSDQGVETSGWISQYEKMPLCSNLDNGQRRQNVRRNSGKGF